MTQLQIQSIIQNRKRKKKNYYVGFSNPINEATLKQILKKLFKEILYMWGAHKFNILKLFLQSDNNA